MINYNNMVRSDAADLEKEILFIMKRRMKTDK